MSVHSQISKLTAMSLANRRGAEPLVGLTASTAPMAAAMDSHVDFILVGDSLAMTIYGENSTVGVDLETMIRHGCAPWFAPASMLAWLLTCPSGPTKPRQNRHFSLPAVS